MSAAQTVSGGKSEGQGKKGCRVVFPVAGLLAGRLAQHSGRILQTGCREKLHLRIVQEREKEEG